MARNKILLILFVFSVHVLSAGTTYRYLVFLRDKPQQFDPSQFFTKKALEKRMRFNIPFDESDIPCNAGYMNQIGQLGATVQGSSRWFNAVQVDISDPSILDKVKALPFVTKIQLIGDNTEKTLVNNKFSGLQSCDIISGEENTTTVQSNENTTGFEDTYTSSYAQFHLLNGEYLHQQGFNGEGMTIAICDDGFNNANNNPAFSSIFSENRVLGTYDYVNGDSAVFDSNDGSHGAYCFSFIGGYKASQYIGTSSKAKFYLFHTEDDAHERLQEEYNLAMALESCDQVGVDVVSISLGYNKFDVSSEDHDTSDMHKNNTPAAIAVNKAVSRGMIVCAAAGNQYGWIYIATPSDADSAICVAAVDINGNVASFSGYGLPGDPRIKPNVAAMGVSAAFLNTSGVVNYGGGTSFSTPSLAGMITCLWQAFPSKTNWEIKTAVEQSASQYLTPDKRIGYGIPDFQKAYQLLSVATYVSNPALESNFSIFPNPFDNVIHIVNKGNYQIQSIQVMNAVGQVIYSENAPSENTITLDQFSTGMYLMQIATNEGMILKKIIKD